MRVCTRIFYILENKVTSKHNPPVPIRKGKLTERLLTEGLLTPQMLQELQNEWSKKRK